MRVGILAPIDNSPFALAVAELCHREPGVEVAGIVVRRAFGLARMRNELRRDGVRLLRKAWRKLVVKDGGASGERGFYDVVRELGEVPSSLSRWARQRQVRSIRVADHNDPAAIALLRSAGPEVVAFTGGGLVRRPLLEACGRGLLNAHMGILPPYRGMDVVEWPILEGRHASIGLGVTLHCIDPGVDTGPIVAIHPVAIEAGDNMERLRTRFEPVMVEAMLDGVRRARDGTLAPRPQDRAAGRQYYVLHPRLYERARGAVARLAGQS